MMDLITTEHLSRLAIIYVRQSSMGQVQNNRESTQRQYSLVHRAQEYGWPEARIETIDGDLGMSGAVAGLRQGFDRLCRKIALGEVGAVFGIEVSRLARNTVEWFQLLDLCSRSNTVIVEDSHVYAPGRNDHDLVLGIKGTVSASELSIIKARLIGGQRNKAARGALYNTLPAGYVLSGETLLKDPDLQTRAAIERVFSRFHETGSARATAQLLRESGERLPVRHNGKTTWQDASYSRVQLILKKPIMAGVYAWARQSVPRDRPYSERWRVWIPDHHEGYVDLPTWCRIQDQMFRNQGKLGPGRGALREGPAMLQGLAVCGHCGCSMSSQYNKLWRYICWGRKNVKGTHDGCFSTGGVRIDTLVTRCFLDAIGPAGMAAAIEAEKRLVVERESALRSYRLELERCRYDASLAERRYRQIDPDNRLIASTLEHDWEKALRALECAKTQLATAEAEQSPVPDPDLLVTLGRDLSTVWTSDGTTSRDRKRLLSCLLDEVILSIDHDARQIGVQLQWKGGRSDEYALPILTGKRDIKRDDADTVDLLRRLAAFYPDGEIARILNRQKRVTARGLAYTGSRVAALRGRHGIAICPPREADTSGCPTLSVSEASAELGVTGTTLYRWIRKGLVPSVQPDISGAPVRVRLTDDFRSRFCPSPPEGFVPLATAVARLGVSRQTIWKRMRAGTLQAIYVTRGRHRGLHVLISPDMDMPLLSGLDWTDTGQARDD